MPAHNCKKFKKTIEEKGIFEFDDEGDIRYYIKNQWITICPFCGYDFIGKYIWKNIYDKKDDNHV